MAILEITDPEGSVWELEDNGNSKEAIARFKAAWRPRLKKQAPEEPGFYSPGQVANRAGEGAINTIPFVGAALRMAEGQPAYGEGVEGFAGGLGDVSNALLTGATLGKGLGAGAVLNAGLEASGINEGLRRSGESSEDVLNKILGTNLPSKLAGVEGLGTVANTLTRAPGAIANTALQFLPAILAGATKAKKIPGVPESVTNRFGLKPAPGAAGLLQEYGGKATPAMVQYAETGQKSGMPSAMENVARANPLTSGMLERTDKANVGAVGKYASEKLPMDLNVGDSLTQAFEDFQKRRGALVDRAKEGVRAMPEVDYLQSPGTVASSNMRVLLKKAGVPFENGEFDLSKMKKFEKMDPATAEAIVQVEKDIRGAQPGEIVNYLENFDKAYGQQWKQKYGNSATTAIRQVRGIIKDAITKSLSDAKNPELAEQYQSANELYSKTQPTVRRTLAKVRKINEGEMGGDIFDAVFGKQPKHAEIGLEKLSKGMTPDEFGQLQDSLAAGIIEHSKKDGILSLAKLKASLEATGNSQKYLKPEARAAFQDLVKMMETAGISELAQPNPSGTGSRAVANTLLGGLGGGALLGHPGPLAAAGAGSGLSALYLKSPQIKAALGKALQRPLVQDTRALAAPLAGAKGSEDKQKKTLPWFIPNLLPNER